MGRQELLRFVERFSPPLALRLLEPELAWLRDFESLLFDDAELRSDFRELDDFCDFIVVLL